MENKRIPFDWDKYQSGEYEVVCRNGSKPILAGFNPDAEYREQVIGWVLQQGSMSWGKNGFFEKGEELDYDLFLIPKPKKFKKWINLYSDGNTIESNFESIAKDMSLKYETDSSKYIKTILIEWEA